MVEDKPGQHQMFTIANPLARSGKQRGLLQLWDPDNGTLKRSVVCNEALSALTVRDDGRFVGVGTMFSGSVDIYIAFSLQVLNGSDSSMLFLVVVVFILSFSFIINALDNK